VSERNGEVEAPEVLPLSVRHALLITGSAIAPEVALARGYRTVTIKAELWRLGFADYQCSVPTLLVPVYDVHGELATYQSRPDTPRISNGKALKYETPKGTRMVVDVPPAARASLGNPAIPLCITEGVRKDDAAVSAGLCCVAVLGVWNWRGKNPEGGLTALSDWDSIALNGRRVIIVFDSDVMVKPQVHAALARLKAFLESRHAIVELVYLPPGDGGEKVGLDDFLAAGHDAPELLALATATLRPLEHDAAAADGRREVVVSGRYLREISDEAVSAVLSAQAERPDVFVRGTVLVRLIRDREHGLTAGALDVPSLRGVLDRTADFISVDEEGSVRPARPPLDVVQDILALPEPPFPRLRAITSVPLFIAGGDLIRAEGYHATSEIYFNLGALGVSRSMPTPAAARTIILEELLGDFPFADDASRAHAVALLLERFVRPLISGLTPLYLIDAPARGTGKGLLADVVGRIVTGGTAAVVAPTADGDEIEKRITSLLLAGSPLILLDNVTSLRSTALAAVLTAEVWEGRLLGRSQMLRLRNDATWLATGNNVELSDELARRVIPIRLDAACAEPEERTGFRHPDLAGWVSMHRTELLAACLALIQHWVDAGMPAGRATLGRFESWARVMGGILECTDVPGFLSNRAHLRETADVETREWMSVCEAWYETYGERPISASALVALLHERELLLDIWAGRGALGGQQRLGHALGRRRDRVFGDYTIRDAGRDSATGSAAYRLEHREERKTTETPETPLREAALSDSGTGVSVVSGVSAKPAADHAWEEVVE